MTARVANPSIRWIAAYLAAAVVGSLAASIGTSFVTPPAEGVIGAWLIRGLPLVMGLMFVPVAVISWFLHRTGRWNAGWFALTGAALPVVFFLGLALSYGAANLGDNFLPLMAIWGVAGAIGGAVFHAAWEWLA